MESTGSISCLERGKHGEGSSSSTIVCVGGGFWGLDLREFKGFCVKLLVTD